MKKSSVWLLALMMAFVVVLSACSSNESADKGSGDANTAGQEKKNVKLSILAWNNETEMKPVLDGFTAKYPHITFDFQFAPPVKDYIAKLQTMLLTDTATDIFIIAAENRNEVIDGGHALDLTDYPFMEVMLDSNKPMLSKDGRTYAFTNNGWVGGWFYNKKLFEEAGIEEMPETWDEFVAICLQLKEAGITPLYDNMQDLTQIHSALYGNMTLSQDPEFDNKIFAGEKTFAEGWTDVFELWKKDMIDTKILTPDMIGLTGDQIESEFTLGNVAMFFGGPWSIAKLTETPDLDFGMIPVPGPNPGENYYVGAPGVGFAVNSKSSHQEEALLFLEYLSTQEGLDLFYEGTGLIMTAKDYEAKVHPSMQQAYQEGLMEGRIYLPMVTWPRHQEALRNQFVISTQDMAVGKITPEEAAAAIDKKFNEMENK
ncbi:carbohydrate ABC transporter substrate-binding protein [Xylanibacillus composti]|uniref:Sugar ABC transporter substrate-binding protein n=1 Tax=Xylanibacillus composti TaxID=1572762 RepID=A0A8J4M173_9BACL|nr:ABC transporter substrate-binding protein [Xylanibacillus composti]MDT9724984.1 carbohydrate ABC transporter substrate-binding protein [Xylanibacillus composti]GIQ68224.1 sugar ABC transporter substrate-binding protein [Xylanibacillus composti]